MSNPCPRTPEELKRALEEKELLLHATAEAMGSPAVPISPRPGPCTCYTTPTGKEMCWKSGFLGTLSQAQMAQYCTTKEIKGKSKRAEEFTEAVHAAKERYDKAGKPGIETWLSMVGEEARKRGIEI